MNKKQLKEKIYKYYTIFEKFYENNKNVFESKNLKCYDANYYLYTKAVQDYPTLDDDDRAHVWEDFCDCEFDNFRIEFDLDNLKYIGRTSSFLLIPKELQGYLDINDCKNAELFALELISYNIPINHFNGLYYNNKQDFINDVENMDQELAIDFLDNLEDFDIAKIFEECINISNYLDEFKKNQVDIIKGYCEGAVELKSMGEEE